MSERDQEWIERYLAGELTDEERTILESKMVEDAVFKNEVEKYRLIIESLKLKRRNELLERFKKKDQILRRAIPWKSIAAAILVVCGAIWLWNSRNPNPKINDTVAPIIDSSSIHEKEVVLKDSIINVPKSAENVVEQTVLAPKDKNVERKIPKSKEQPIADSKVSHEELYAMNFEPYKDESMNLDLRGEDAMSPYDQFVSNYWDGKYQVVIDSFNILNAALQKNDNVLFIKANALMSINRIDEATVLLEHIIASDRSRYKIESRWNLGLCYLKKNEIVKAKEQLEIVKSLHDPKYNKAVDKLLSQL